MLTIKSLWLLGTGLFGLFAAFWLAQIENKTVENWSIGAVAMAGIGAIIATLTYLIRTSLPSIQDRFHAALEAERAASITEREHQRKDFLESLNTISERYEASKVRTNDRLERSNKEVVDALKGLTESINIANAKK